MTIRLIRAFKTPSSAKMVAVLFMSILVFLTSSFIWGSIVCLFCRMLVSDQSIPVWSCTLFSIFHQGSAIKLRSDQMRFFCSGTSFDSRVADRPDLLADSIEFWHLFCMDLGIALYTIFYAFWMFHFRDRYLHRFQPRFRYRICTEGFFHHFRNVVSQIFGTIF